MIGPRLDALLGGWRQTSAPLARALATAIRDAVLDGRLPVGTRLPSERALAATLRVSRGTVVSTLSALRDTGWIHTRHGSGSQLRLPAELTDRIAPWTADDGAGLDLTRAVPAGPQTAYIAACRRAVQRCAVLLLDSAEATAGLPALRELIAERYTRDGLPTRPEQILVTSGSRAALTLLADHLPDRSRPVMVESPTYHGALAILRRRRARLTAIPVTHTGWGVERLAHAMATNRPALVYLTPDFHNPTGTQMPMWQRKHIAELAARYSTPVVVDETLRELDLRTPPRPIAHLAGANVLAIGSTSKLVWGGLRVGWLRTTVAQVRELCLNPLQARLSPPPLEQLIAVDLLANPEHLLRQRRDQLRTQRDHLVGLLDGAGDWSFTVPSGGLSLWLQLHGRPAAGVADQAARRGLRLSTGQTFSADRTLTRYLRLPYTATNEILNEAVGILIEAASA